MFALTSGQSSSSLPECQIWSETYYEPFKTSPTPSIQSPCPDRVLIAHYWEWQQVEILYSSVVLHSVFDLPVHNHDAHRHFFRSAITVSSAPSLTGTEASWSSGHLVERLLVLMATFYVFLSFILGQDSSRGQPGLPDGLSLLYVFRAGVSTAGTVK